MGAAIETRERAKRVFWYHLMANGRCAPVFLSLSPPFSVLPSDSPPTVSFLTDRRILFLSFPFPFPLPLSATILWTRRPLETSSPVYLP